MTKKLHIEHIIQDEEAHFLLDEMLFFERKFTKFRDTLFLSTRKNSRESNINKETLDSVETFYYETISKLNQIFFSKYYFDSKIDNEGYMETEISDGREIFHSDKISIVKTLLMLSFGRKYGYFEYSKEANAQAKKLGFPYFDKKKDLSSGKKYIEFIFNTKTGVNLLKKMESNLQSAKDELNHYVATGTRLYKKNHLIEFVNLVHKVEESYYFDPEVDYYGTIKNAFCEFETVDKFKEAIEHEQEQRRTRKTQPKIIVEKAKLLRLM